MNLLPAYGILSAIYKDGAYATLLLNKGVDPFTEELVNQVLERHFYYYHTVMELSKNAPRPKARIIIMMGLAMLTEMREPAYAVIDTCVKLAKELTLFETGYINALLKRYSEGERAELNGKAKTEAEFNLPYELFELVKKDYPRAFLAILKVEPLRKSHVWLKKGFSEKVLDAVVYEKSEFGYFVKSSPIIRQLFEEGVLTYQSLASMYAVHALSAKSGEKILDLCAAPGGKSVALADLGATVVAAELHPHRAELINSYAARMDVPVDIRVMDGTLMCNEFCNAFDKVIVDAPCSGLGVLSKRKDMILKRTAKDIISLTETQAKLLDTAAHYVKPGGLLVYSTCTILKAENTAIAKEFLSRHSEFVFDPIPLKFTNTGEVQFLPDGKGMDGFYIARFKKV